MIIVTGAAGFVGSNMVKKLNQENYKDIILVDDFSRPLKENNYNSTLFTQLIDRDIFPDWLRVNHRPVQFVFHLGARTDTSEQDQSVFNNLNLNYSKHIWNICTEFGIPLVYASSAATYGSGENGYSDDHNLIPSLKPLNLYGKSKNDFDKWVLKQENQPSFWAGLKFFNVYGPCESHKNRMASVILHAYNQIKQTGKMKLFRSHKPDFADGEQKRDFIYVKDVVDVMFFFLLNRKNRAIYNLGTGKAETFSELVHQTFKAMNKKPLIEYIDTPEDIRDNYQYFTEAKVEKLRKAGYLKPFTSLAHGVNDYVRGFLMEN